jgi:hypothetical protein
MENPIGLRDIIDSLADHDGSRERVEQLGSIVDDGEEMRVLLENSAFRKIINTFQEQMKHRLIALIESDPELTALMNVMKRTIGLVHMAEKAEEAIQDIVEGKE